MMNIGKMMKKAQELQVKMEEAQSELKSLEVEGTSGAGLVKIILSGKHEMRSVSIDSSLVEQGEKDMLEDLIQAAYNDALTKVQGETQERMAAASGGLDLPGGMKLPF